MQDLVLRTQVTLEQTLRDLVARTRNDDGQTSIEYLGIVIVVVGILGVIIAAAPGIGQSIVSRIQSAISGLG